MTRGEDGEWENGLRGAVVPAPEHRRACAGFSTPVLATESAECLQNPEPGTQTLSQKNSPLTGPKKYRKSPKSSKGLYGPKSTKKVQIRGPSGPSRSLIVPTVYTL